MIITGDMGFVGSYLTQEIEGLGLDLKNGNDILHCPLPDSDVVIHLAAQTSVLESLDSPMRDAEINILGTIRLAERYRESRFIFASSGGAIQEKIESPYGLSKFCAEEYIKMLCKDYVILRFPNIYGKGSKSVVDKFINEPINIYGDGSATRDFVHISDLIEAIKQSLTWPKGTYLLGSGQNTSVLEIAKATGKSYKHTPAIKGELHHSYVSNTAPDWEARIKVLDYIHDNVSG